MCTLAHAIAVEIIYSLYCNAAIRASEKYLNTKRQVCVYVYVVMVARKKILRNRRNDEDARGERERGFFCYFSYNTKMVKGIWYKSLRLREIHL